MSQPLIRSDNENGVVTLTLNRTEVHNAFDDVLVHSLADAFNDIEHDGAVRVVVLTGGGLYFSAGADLNWMRSMAGGTEAENERDALHMARMLRLLNYLRVPTIARVNGAAFGGGLGLIACCDITIACESAHFALTEARLGMAPAVISPYVYRHIGESHARRYFLTGEQFDATSARRMGLIQQVVPESQLDATVQAAIDGIMLAGPNAITHSKRLIFHAAGYDAESQVEIDRHTAREIARLRISSEGQEGMAAFLEKRKPAWVA